MSVGVFVFCFVLLVFFRHFYVRVGKRGDARTTVCVCNCVLLFFFFPAVRH